MYLPTHKFDQYDKNFSYELFTTNVTSDPIGLQVLATGVVRKIIECFFQQRELRWLDDLLPGAGKKESEKVFIKSVLIYTPPPTPNNRGKEGGGEMAIKLHAYTHIMLQKTCKAPFYI